MFSPRAAVNTPLSHGGKKGQQKVQGSVPDLNSRMNDSECMSEIGKNLSRQASLNGELTKKKTLHMYDFKKFKPLRKDIQTFYKLGKVIGQGAFGQVRVCKHFATNKEFAIKIMQKKEIEQ